MSVDDQQIIDHVKESETLTDEHYCTETSNCSFVTRRSILLTVNSTYDPLQILTALILPAQQIFQDEVWLRCFYSPVDQMANWITSTVSF